jgi:aminoacyl tRNA synthase complex-interacting multifunctional protein 1
VGNIIDCWKHPQSDYLYCEKVDMGNGEVREIASGLQFCIEMKDMKGLVVVLANLKPRSMGGNLSFRLGMHFIYIYIYIYNF